LRFWAATHISKVNCVEMAGDRPRQPAYKIFNIKCRFSSPSPDPLSSRKFAHMSVKEGYTSKKVVIYSLLACLVWKWLQIGTDMLLNITSTGDELFRNANIGDLEW